MTGYRKTTLVLAACFVCSIGLMISCSSSGGKPTYPAPVDQSLYTFQDTASVPVVDNIKVTANTTETYLGESFSVLKNDTVDNPTQPLGLKALVKIEGSTFKVGKSEVFSPLPGQPAHTYPDLSVLPSKTIEVDMNPAIGVAQKIKVSGDLVLGDPSKPQNHTAFVDKEITYTLLDDNASVETPMGVVTGTKKYSISGVYLNEPVTGTVWYKDNLGPIAGTAESALLPSKLAYGLKNIQTGGAHGTDTYVVQGAGAVSTSNQFLLDTYAIKGKADVDKNQHTYYLLEFRWADPVRAATTEMPPLTFEFGTTMGIFPESYSTPVMSPISLFGDQDGYNYWEVFASEGAKNESFNPISVHIKANWNIYQSVKPGDVQVQARIDYPVYKGP